MAEQTQYSVQNTRATIAGTSSNDGGLMPAIDAEVRPPLFITFANSELKYQHNKKSDDELCDGEREGFCLFAFTRSCKPSPVCIAGICPEHHRAIFRRSYVAMPLSNMITLVPVPEDRANYIVTLPLLTFMRSDVTYTEISNYVHEIDLAPQERDSIIKFLRILCCPYANVGMNRESNGPNTISFRTYMLEYMYAASRAFRGIDIMNIRINMYIYQDYYESNKNNAAFMSILSNSTQVGTADDDALFYQVPLYLLNVIDIMFILGYHVDAKVNEIGYAPNVDIVDGKFFHGTGHGLNNSMTEYINATSSNSRQMYTQYSEPIRQALLSAGIKLFANLDVLTTSVCPMTKGTNPQVFVPVSKSTPPKNHFNLETVYTELFHSRQML